MLIADLRFTIPSFLASRATCKDCVERFSPLVGRVSTMSTAIACTAVNLSRMSRSHCAASEVR
jgi:hypothetical protein